MHSLNSFERPKKDEKIRRDQDGMIDHKITSHDQIDDFLKLAKDWEFDFGKGTDQPIESMNIIFDNVHDQILV